MGYSGKVCDKSIPMQTYEQIFRTHSKLLLEK